MVLFKVNLLIASAGNLLRALLLSKLNPCLFIHPFLTLRMPLS